jgi:hypothetical protein
MFVNSKFNFIIWFWYLKIYNRNRKNLEYFMQNNLKRIIRRIYVPKKKTAY